MSDLGDIFIFSFQNDKVVLQKKFEIINIDAIKHSIPPLNPSIKIYSYIDSRWLNKKQAENFFKHYVLRKNTSSLLFSKYKHQMILKTEIQKNEYYYLTPGNDNKLLLTSLNSNNIRGVIKYVYQGSERLVTIRNINGEEFS